VFYERFHDLSQAQATTAFMMLVLVGGIPGILLGGRLADRYAGRIEGARVVIPAYCIWISMAFVTPSYLPVPFPVAFALQVVSFFVMTMAIPALRAGLTDVVPANLRGTGFGAFNLISVVIGAAGAPVVVGALADLTNLRVAFLSTTPVVLVGAFVLYRARVHLEADAAKIFEAVMRAIQEQQARDAEAAGSDGETPG